MTVVTFFTRFTALPGVSTDQRCTLRVFSSLFVLITLLCLPHLAAAQGKTFRDWYAACSEADLSCRADTFIKGDNNPIGFDYRVSWRRDTPEDNFVLVAIHVAVGTGFEHGFNRRVFDKSVFVRTVGETAPLQADFPTPQIPSLGPEKEWGVLLSYSASLTAIGLFEHRIIRCAKV